jgi:hypothetical protein
MHNGQQVILVLDKKHMALLFISLFFIIIGSRAAVINYSGSFTPFLDEWDGDAAGLLKPYITADLTIRDLFSPFNEHIILFTRLLVLAIFHISGYWDVILQMVVNAVLDAVTIVGISYALSRVLGGAWAVALMVISTLINAIPLSYDSILMAFNTHFYLLLAFSFASLWYLADSRAWSPRWAVGVLCAVASFLCMASGALTLAAAIGLHVSQTACGRRGGPWEWLGIAALAAATFTLTSLVPHVAESDPYTAHSLREFLSKLLELATWPAAPIFGWLIVLPSALFCLRTLADCPALTDPRWYNVAAFGWILTQFLALAAGRAGMPIVNRYFDTLLIGVAINLTSIFWLLGSQPIGGQRKLWRRLALAAWLVLVAASLARSERHLPEYLSHRRQTAEVQAQNLRSYLATGDALYLTSAPGVEKIPYPVSSRLRELLDTSEIRAVLSPELLSRDTPQNFVEAFKRNFLRLSFMWLGLGVLLLIATVASAALTPVRPRANGFEGPAALR